MQVCCKHCVLLQLHVYCPSVDIGLCVGFLYTVVMRVMLDPGVTLVSRKGRDPFWSGSSTVNCMFGSCVLMCGRSC